MIFCKPSTNFSLNNKKPILTLPGKVSNDLKPHCPGLWGSLTFDQQVRELVIWEKLFPRTRFKEFVCLLSLIFGNMYTFIVKLWWFVDLLFFVVDDDQPWKHSTSTMFFCKNFFYGETYWYSNQRSPPTHKGLTLSHAAMSRHKVAWTSPVGSWVVGPAVALPHQGPSSRGFSKGIGKSSNMD